MPTKKAFRVYVAGPMTKGDPKENLRRAIEAGERLIAAGLAPHLPQLMYTWGEFHPHSHTSWLQIDLPWVEAADAVVRLGGESKGADMETACAEKAGVPVFRGCGNRECTNPQCDDMAATRCIEFFTSYKQNLEEARRNMPAPPPEEIRVDPPTDVEIKMAPLGLDPSRALRFDSGKLRYDLIPPEWEEALALVLTKGAAKYADDNWQNSAGKPESFRWRRRCLASLRRHLAAWQRGEHLDPEIETRHLAQVAWNALAIMWYDIREGKGAPTEVQAAPVAAPQALAEPPF